MRKNRTQVTSFLTIIVLVISVFFGAFANASQQDDFLKAKAAFKQKDVQTLALLADKLTKQNYLLAPYSEYWLMLSIIDQITHTQAHDFMVQYQDYPFADRFRGEWLKVLGEHRDWKSFLAIHPQYHLKDRGVECYYALAQADANGYKTLSAYKSLWIQAKSQPDGCDALYDKMQATGVMKESDIRSRFRLALSHNRRSLAKSIATRSNSASAKVIKQIDLAYKKTDKVLKNRSISLSNSYGKEVNLFALDRVARKSSDKALKAFSKIKRSFNAEARSYFYGRLALRAAKRHEPSAYPWFQLAIKHTQLTDEQFEWFTRSALRRGDWNGVLSVINRMPDTLANHATWRYWRGRAYQAQGDQEKANALFVPLSAERHYYGWLAKDELGDPLNTQARHYTPTQQDVIEFGSKPSVQRAVALKALELDRESRLEWRHAIAELDDRQLIAGAEFANRKQWYITSIYTADRTKQIHNYDLRYPRPYRRLLKPASNDRGIDEAWVYGIVRQESRFMHDAKSRTGAGGLMQVMPATGRWVAKKIGFKGYKNHMLYDINTNTKLGTHYMKTVLDQFNGQETMTTAAYNAGPSRAKKWQSNRQLDGTIYTETIPFNETRNYVKRVMANAHIYAQRLQLKNISLKQRVGTIPAKQ